MRYLSLSLLLLLAPLAARAADFRVERVDIVDTGIYSVEVGEAILDPNAPTGTIAAPVTATLVESTTTVRGELGLEFGLRYVVVGEPSGAAVPLDLVIIYPPPGLADPADPEPLRESGFAREKKIGETVYLGYAFENPWEIVPGEWTFEIWFDGRKLASQTFTVSK